MDFLKSAVSSAIFKDSTFPYNQGERVDIDQSIWTLHDGISRENGSKCSIFTFDIIANKSRLPLARNAVRKLQTIRHPGVIRVLAVAETPTHIRIATERLVPLGWQVRRKSLAEETTKWGLYSIAKTVKFINSDASSIHGNVRVSSIFTSESGEWRLGGFDVLSSVKDDDAIIYTYGSLMPDSGRYAPPEIAKGGWDATKKNPIHAIDAFDFGILITESFSGSFSGADQVGQTKNIPPSMHQCYKRLVNANPKARLSVGSFLDQGQRSGGFFQTSLIQITEDIENLGLKADAEKEELLSQLDDLADDFPEDFFKMKVLPELMKSVEFGGGGPKVFGVVMRISSKLSEDEYESKITPVIVRLFSSPDRAIRVCLLDNLPLMIDHLPQKIVNDKIYPQMVTGFTDIAPLVREQTVKAVLTIVPKLSDRVLNGELLRYLAKTANDEQPGIRTNTTICLGKMARNLSAGTRTKVLTAAFSRSLRDPFVHARNAALMALSATADLFSEEDCSTKLLPCICPSLVDKEKIVREQANKAMDVYLARVRKYSQTLPDSVLPPPSAGNASVAAPRMGTPAADTSWAGWAISSFTNKLASVTGEMQAAPNGAAASQPSSRPSSVPPSASTSNGPLQHPRSNLGHSSKPANPFGAPSPVPRSPEPDVETEDFGAWDDGPLVDAKADDPKDDFDPFAQPKPKGPSAPFEDHGEPDFAGWLNAQTKAKGGSKKPLPKGLSKVSGAAARPASASRPSSAPQSGVAARKPAVVRPKPKEAPKAEKKDEDEDAWGDAWD